MSRDQKVVVVVTLLVLGWMCVLPPGRETVSDESGRVFQRSCKGDLLWTDRPDGVSIDAGALLARLVIAASVGGVVLVCVPSRVTQPTEDAELVQLPTTRPPDQDGG